MNLNNNKSVGPISIPIRILKYCVDIITEPLSQLINISFNQGTFPNILKTAKIVPIFKKGDPLLCSNYCPIFLFTIFCKVFEKCCYTRLYSFLNKPDLFYKKQFGFRSKHFINDALVNLFGTVKKQICSVQISTNKLQIFKICSLFVLSLLIYKNDISIIESSNLFRMNNVSKMDNSFSIFNRSLDNYLNNYTLTGITSVFDCKEKHLSFSLITSESTESNNKHRESKYYSFISFFLLLAALKFKKFGRKNLHFLLSSIILITIIL